MRWLCRGSEEIGSALFEARRLRLWQVSHWFYITSVISSFSVGCCVISEVVGGSQRFRWRWWRRQRWFRFGLALTAANNISDLENVSHFLLKVVNCSNIQQILLRNRTQDTQIDNLQISTACFTFKTGAHDILDIGFAGLSEAWGPGVGRCWESWKVFRFFHGFFALPNPYIFHMDCPTFSDLCFR